MVTMNIKRILKHLMMPQWRLKRIFSDKVLREIEHLIKASESAHSGEIRFVVEAALDCPQLFKAQSARARAIDLFSELRMWDTEQNNGLLIYLLLADRAVEIVADRGVNAKVDADEWRNICRAMESDFSQGNFKGGMAMGIHSMTSLLTKYFPVSNASSYRNELSDKPVIL
jgi:uncharacterized membrane protein